MTASLWGLDAPVPRYTRLTCRRARTKPTYRLKPEQIRRGEKHGNAKVADTLVLKAHRLRARGMLLREIATEVGAALSTVRSWLTGARRSVAALPVYPPRFAPVTEEQIAEVRRLSAEGLPQWRIADAVGLSQARVSRIVRGRL